MDEYSDPLKDRVLVSLAETSRLLGGVCENTVRNIIARGELEVTYVGDRPMVIVRSIYAKLNGPAVARSSPAKTKASRQNLVAARRKGRSRKVRADSVAAE